MHLPGITAAVAGRAEPVRRHDLSDHADLPHPRSESPRRLPECVDKCARTAFGVVRTSRNGARTRRRGYQHCRIGATIAPQETFASPEQNPGITAAVCGRSFATGRKCLIVR